MLQCWNSTISWRINLWKMNTPARIRMTVWVRFFPLNRKSLSFKGTDFMFAETWLAWASAFSLASHLLSLVVLRFVANWPSVSSIVRRYWWSRWHRKSLRYLQETEVLASLQVKGILFSLKMNFSLCVCLYNVSLCARMCVTALSLILNLTSLKECILFMFI